MIDELLQTSIDLEALAFSSNSEKRYVGRIVDEIMSRHYGKETDSISLDQLLDWEMWQTYIRIHSKLQHLYVQLLAIKINKELDYINISTRQTYIPANNKIAMMYYGLLIC